MTFVYLICFILLVLGAVLVLGLTPDRITEDIMRFASPKQTLREKVLTAKGKKKSRKLTVELNRISSKVTGLRFFGLAERLRTSLRKKVDLIEVHLVDTQSELYAGIIAEGIKIYGI